MGINFTPEAKQWFIDNSKSGNSIEYMIENMQKLFNLRMSRFMVSHYRHKFDCLTPNKGRFQANHTPKHHLNIGSERMFGDSVMIKVDKNTWKSKARVVYEQYHNINLTDDDYIVFLDNNNKNFNIGNLMKVSRAENVYVNSNQLRLSDIDNIAEYNKAIFLTTRLHLHTIDKEYEIIGKKKRIRDRKVKNKRNI